MQLSRGFVRVFINPIQHLKSVNESYFQHGFFAVKWGLFLVITGIVSIIHGFFPFLFPFMAPKNVLKLKKVLDDRKEDERIRQIEGDQK
jgi:hypothetical protein